MPRDCPHRPACPGCPRFGEPGVEPAALAALTAFAAAQGLPAPAVSGGPLRGYRHRARLAIRGPRGAPRLGLFESGSHWVVPIPHCEVHHPLVSRVGEAVRAVLARRGIKPYVERTHTGSARYLQVAVERATQTAQLVLVTRDETPESLAAAAEELQERLAGSLHSLFWNGNPERGNAILGPTWHRFCGPEALRESFGGASVFYPPDAFGQSNLPLAERLIGELRELVPQGARVLELYAGAGAIGLSLLGGLRELTLNEVAAGGLRGLELGMAALPAAERARVRVHPGPAAGAAGLVADADVVIADPPRRGLDREIIDALRAGGPHTLLLVSCSAPAFLRDAQALLADGRFALRRLGVYAMFPFTDHIETLALFERAPAGRR